MDRTKFQGFKVSRFESPAFFVALQRMMPVATASARREVTYRENRILAWCALLLVIALYVVGVVSKGIVRHAVQTAPVWVTVVLGMRRSNWSKWTALPCFLFWLFVTALIWLFLLGWSHVISGTFSGVEIAMTLVVGFCSVAGLVAALRMTTRTRAICASTVFLLTLVVQFLVFRISFLPSIAHDRWR
ncbi:MAG: hypothetical protein ACM3PW_01335 [Chlamydiota bacterium]